MLRRHWTSIRSARATHQDFGGLLVVHALVALQRSIGGGFFGSHVSRERGLVRTELLRDRFDDGRDRAPTFEDEVVASGRRRTQNDIPVPIDEGSCEPAIERVVIGEPRPGAPVPHPNTHPILEMVLAIFRQADGADGRLATWGRHEPPQSTAKPMPCRNKRNKGGSGPQVATVDARASGSGPVAHSCREDWSPPVSIQKKIIIQIFEAILALRSARGIERTASRPDSS